MRGSARIIHTRRAGTANRILVASGLRPPRLAAGTGGHAVQEVLGRCAVWADDDVKAG